MPTVKEIEQQLKDAGVPMLIRGSIGREILALTQSLFAEEVVRHLVPGEYNGKKGALVATDGRLLFVQGGLIGNAVEDFPYNRVTSVEYQGGFRGSSVRVHASGNVATLDKAKPDLAQKLVAFAREQVSKGSVTSAPPSPVPQGDIVAQLERLNALRGQGAISEEEYATLKQKLIGT